MTFVLPVEFPLALTLPCSNSTKCAIQGAMLMAVYTIIAIACWFNPESEKGAH